MAGLSDYASKGLLNHLAGAQAIFALPAVFLALMTAVGTDANTGFTEVSSGSYARVQIAGTGTTNGTTAAGNAILHFAATPAWIVAGMYIYDVTAPSVIPAATTVLSVTGTTVTMSANASGAGVGGTDSIAFSSFAAATGSAPSSITNNSVITFATPSGSWGTVIAFALYDALTVGNLLVWDYLGNNAWQPFTVSSASPGVITCKAHGFAVNDNCIISTEFGGTAPTFSASNFTGTLVVAHQTTDTFDVTNAATAVNTSSTGSGMVRKIASQLISTNVVTSFAVSQLTAQAA